MSTSSHRNELHFPRSYHSCRTASWRRPVTCSPMCGSLGYLRTLLRIIKEQKNRSTSSPFSKATTSFRNQLFGEYKATRTSTPEGLEPQFDYCRRITEAIGIACFDLDEYRGKCGSGHYRQSCCRASGWRSMAISGQSSSLAMAIRTCRSSVNENVRVYGTWRKEIWLDEIGVKFARSSAFHPIRFRILLAFDRRFR